MSYPKTLSMDAGFFLAVPMGQRIYRMATMCLALTMVSLSTVATAAFDDVPKPDAPYCASVYRGQTDRQEASIGVSVPDGPKDNMVVRVEAYAPDTEHANGTHVAVYTSPLLCI